MDDEDRFRTRRDCRCKVLGGKVEIFIRLDKDRARAVFRHSQSRRDICVRRHDDLVARPQSQGTNGKAQRIKSRIDPHGVPRSRIRRELPLKRRPFIPQDIVSGAQDAQSGGFILLPMPFKLSPQDGKINLHAPIPLPFATNAKIHRSRGYNPLLYIYRKPAP